MKVFQNKIVVGIFCIVIAAAMAFVLLPSINKGKNGTTKIYKLKQNVISGTKIEEDMLEEKEVGKYGLPESLVLEKNEILGKYAVCDIMSDDLILSSKLGDFAASEKLDKISSEGKMLVTVSLDTVASAVGNHLQSGDIISIIGYVDDNAVNYPDLKNLEIYSIENDDAQNLDDVENDEEAKQVASSVTLIVNESQAEKLVYAEYAGKVHAVFVKRGV